MKVETTKKPDRQVSQTPTGYSAVSNSASSKVTSA